MKRLVGGLTAVALALAVPSPAARAGDEPEHRYLAYAVALAAGYSPAEAKIMSDGAWSPDMNSATTALHGAFTDGARLAAAVTAIAANKDLSRQLLDPRDTGALDKLLFTPDSPFGRIGQGAFYHALFKDPAAVVGQANTPSLDAAWPKYISEQMTGLKNASLQRDDLNTAKLLLTGQYLHQLLDSYVHPTDPVFGHAKDGHAPDYAINNPQRYAEAVQRMLGVLRSNPDFRPAGDDRFKALKLDSAEDRARFARDLVTSLNRGYDPKYDPDNPERSKWRFKNYRSLSDDDKTNTRGSVEAFMNQLLKERGYFDKFPEDGKGGKFTEFKIGAYTPANYTANKDDPSRFRVSYDDKALARVDNFVQWILKRPEYQKLVDSVRADVREKIRNVAISQMLDDKIRSIKDSLIDVVKKGEKPDPAKLKLLEILEAERDERIRKMTIDEKLAELDKLLDKPDRKEDRDLLDLARSLQNTPGRKALPPPAAPTAPKSPYVIPPRKAPTGPAIPIPSATPPALPPAPSPPRTDTPRVRTEDNPPRLDRPTQQKQPPRPDDPTKEKPVKEKKSEGPFWVSYYRKGDYPKGGELYGAYKTRAEAMKAVASIQRWAATIKDPTWSIEAIEVTDDSTGETQLLWLQGNGNRAPPRGTGNGAGGGAGSFGPGWVNVTPRPGPPVKPNPHPHHPGGKQGGPHGGDKTPGNHPHQPHGKPGQGGKRITYEDGKRGRWTREQLAAVTKDPKGWKRGKDGNWEKKKPGRDMVAMRPKPTGGTGPNVGTLSIRKPPGNKLKQPGNGTGGKPHKPGNSVTKPGHPGGPMHTPGNAGGKPHKPGNSVTSPPHRPHGTTTPAKPPRPGHPRGPTVNPGNSATHSGHPGVHHRTAGNTGNKPHKSAASPHHRPQYATAPPQTPQRPSPPPHNNPPVRPQQPSPPSHQGGGHPARNHNDGRGRALAQLRGQLANLAARIRQHNANKPSPYNHPAVDAYNAEARALRAERDQLFAQLGQMR